VPVRVADPGDVARPVVPVLGELRTGLPVLGDPGGATGRAAGILLRGTALTR